MGGGGGGIKHDVICTLILWNKFIPGTKVMDDNMLWEFRAQSAYFWWRKVVLGGTVNRQLNMQKKTKNFLGGRVSKNLALIWRQQFHLSVARTWEALGD